MLDSVATIFAFLIFMYWLPFACLIGVPLYYSFYRLHLPQQFRIFSAFAVTTIIAIYFYPQVQQCETSFKAQREILSRLNVNDAKTLRMLHSLTDDFYDEKLHFRLSKYCPTYFEYRQNGEMKNVSIHEDEIFYGNGPAQ